MAHVVTPPFSVIVDGAAPPAGGFNWTSQTLDLQQGVSYDLRTSLVNATGLEPLFRFYDGPTLASFGLTLVQPHTLVVSPTAPLGTFTAGPEFVAQVHKLDDIDRNIPDDILAPGEGRATPSSSNGMTWHKAWEQIGDFSGLYWRNFGGDWADQSGIPQGETSWSPAVSIPAGTAESVVQVDLTNLFNAWLSGTRNFGLWLRSLNTSTARIHSKENILGKPKPTVRINGTIDLLPEVDSYTTISGSLSQPGYITPAGAEVDFRISGSSNPARTFLYFNLRGITGPVTSAILSFTTTTWQRLTAMPLLVSRVYLDDRFPARSYEGGYAANYQLDVGIKSDPNTVFAFDFRDFDAGYSAANDIRWREGGWTFSPPMFNNAPRPVPPNATKWPVSNTKNAKVIVGLDPENPIYKPLAPGFPAIKCITATGVQNDAGFFAGSWGFYANMGYKWEDYNIARGHPAGYGHEPEEIYFRYFLFVDETWDPNSNLTGGGGGKFWGAWWLYQPDSSWGVIKPPPQPPGPGPGGTYPALKPNAKGYSGNTGITSTGGAGSSRRGRFTEAGLMDNPTTKAGFRAFATIAEDTMGVLLGDIPPGLNVAQKPYGHDYDWGWRGYLLKGTWNCIEQRFKQNSIDTSGATKTWIGYPFGGRYKEQADGNFSLAVINSALCSAVGTSSTIVLNNRGVSAAISAADSWTPHLIFQPEDVGAGGNGVGWGRMANIVKTGTWVGKVSIQQTLDPVNGPWADITVAAINANIPVQPVAPNTFQNVNGTTHYGIAGGVRYVRAGFKAGDYTSGTLQLALNNNAWSHPSIDYTGYANNMTVEWNGQIRRCISYDPATHSIGIASHKDSPDYPIATWVGGVPQPDDRFTMKWNTSIKERSTIFYGNNIGYIYADEDSINNPRLSGGGGGDTAIYESPGIGRFDGIHQTWINGFLAMDRQQEQWRCIYEMQIQEITLNSFMGGTHHIPTQESALYFAGLVCGRERIGLPGGLFGSPPPTGETITIMAASPSLAHVQAAVTAAVDGDVIGIPDGSATWSGGITTTKQIRIRAQNYTPIPAGVSGTMGQYYKGQGGFARNVTIINNCPADVPVFQFTTGNSYHCGVAGIRFNETGSGESSSAKGPHIRVGGSGSKVPLINDCAFEFSTRVGNSLENNLLAFTCQGGVIWNCVFSGQGFNWDPVNGPGAGQGMPVIKATPRDWDTASTMGMLDTQGTVNTYFEDCTFFICPLVDADTGARVVFRRTVFDGSSGTTHGFSSGPKPGRHIEFYDCEFLNTVGPSHDLAISGAGRNHGRYYWTRGGTLLIADSFCSDQNTGYGNPSIFQATHETQFVGTAPYPYPRQIGRGHTGAAHVSDPVYLWGNTGGSAQNIENDSPAYFVMGRDFFPNTQKPGYSKFTYPHPFRSGVDT